MQNRLRALRVSAVWWDDRAIDAGLQQRAVPREVEGLAKYFMLSFESAPGSAVFANAGVAIFTDFRHAGSARQAT